MEHPNYPFLKLTLDEQFPRLLVTRRPEKKLENQAIYGAFLPTGMVRRMYDLLARVFRLRTCELDIQGDFDAPCPEYFLHRCLAPCVAAVCTREHYLEAVEIVHLFLSDQGALALKKIDAKIENFAGQLEFEKAAEWRDKRLAIEEILDNAKWKTDISAMTEVITLTAADDFIFVHLSTLRRGKTVGRLDFKFPNSLSADDIVSRFISGYYQYYAPKKIFAPSDFPDRKLLENKLSLNFGRKIKIVPGTPEKLPPTVRTAHKLAPHSFLRREFGKADDAKMLMPELKDIFGLRKTPRRVECFDVAHLAGKEIVAARVRAIDGVLQKDDGLVWEFENLSETAALAAAIQNRLRLLPDPKDLPDLILVDGGKAQINAAGKVLRGLQLTNTLLVGAVKPPKAHHQISHFLTANDTRIEFDQRFKSLNFLLTLRDASHKLANETHRRLHSLTQIFKNNETVPRVQYLLVPTRYAERSGNAEDLSPIRSLTQAGEVILKTKRKIPKQ